MVIEIVSVAPTGAFIYGRITLNVLSLFDGISCAMVALDRAGIHVDNYYASEIDKHAIAVSKDNWKDIIHIGDVTKVSFQDGILHTEHGDYEVGRIDLVLAGSPCQGFSMAGKQLAFDDPRSSLYFEFERILNEVRTHNADALFLLENVKMKQESKDVITSRLGVEPIAINSNLVSAQNRYRLYWTNIEGVKQPEDKEIYLQDILEKTGEFTFVDSQKINNRTYCKNYLQYDINGSGHKSQDQRACYTTGKHTCLGTASTHAKVLIECGIVRLTTRIEAERLQTLPDNYTKTVSRNHAMSAIGNGWTVDVIAHILKGIQQ